MKAFLLLLVFVACYAAAVVDDGSFTVTVEQRFVHKDVLKAKQLKRLAKWGKGVRSLPKYHTKFLEGNFKTDYILGNVSMGTPLQGPFSVIMSTGATRLWLANDDIDFITPKHQVYYPEDSDTSSSLSKSFINIDGSFNSTGKWYTDLFEFGKARIKNQGFGYVNSIQEVDNVPFPADGVLGLTHLIDDAYGKNGEPTAPIDNLLHPLIKKIVSIYLDKQVSSSGGAQGTITIGALDKQHCDPSGNTYYFDLSYRSGYDNRYIVYANSLQFGNYYSNNNGYAFFDTGISTLQLPTNDLGAIYNIILPDYDWDTGLYTVSCDSISDYSSISIQLGSQSYVSVDPQNYIVDLGLDGGVCALALEIVGQDEQAEQYVFGTPFFRQYCVAYDFDQNQMVTYSHIN